MTIDQKFQQTLNAIIEIANNSDPIGAFEPDLPSPTGGHTEPINKYIFETKTRFLDRLMNDKIQCSIDRGDKIVFSNSHNLSITLLPTEMVSIDSGESNAEHFGSVDSDCPLQFVHMDCSNLDSCNIRLINLTWKECISFVNCKRVNVHVSHATDRLQSLSAIPDGHASPTNKEASPILKGKKDKNSRSSVAQSTNVSVTFSKCQYIHIYFTDWCGDCRMDPRNVEWVFSFCKNIHIHCEKPESPGEFSDLSLPHEESFVIRSDFKKLDLKCP